MLAVCARGNLGERTFGTRKFGCQLNQTKTEKPKLTLEYFITQHTGLKAYASLIWIG